MLTYRWSRGNMVLYWTPIPSSRGHVLSCRGTEAPPPPILAHRDPLVVGALPQLGQVPTEVGLVHQVEELGILHHTGEEQNPTRRCDMGRGDTGGD